jgi:peptidoglycan/LPS O-acetylase OafA/YrhL
MRRRFWRLVPVYAVLLTLLLAGRWDWLNLDQFPWVGRLMLWLTPLLLLYAAWTAFRSSQCPACHYVMGRYESRLTNCPYCGVRWR